MCAGFKLGNSISIHAPREGGDQQIPVCQFRVEISIHAPREGGDLSASLADLSRAYFNPRPPRGGRPRDPFSSGIS